MKELPDSFKELKNALKGKGAFLWLYEFRYNTQNGGQPLETYATSNPTPITFDGKTYQPYPITFDVIEATSRGDTTGARLTVSNIARAIGALVEHYDGLRDESVRILCVNTDDLGNPLSRTNWLFSIETTTVTDKAVVFDLAGPQLFDEPFPKDFYVRDRCPVAFGSEECGWGFVPGLPGINPPPGVSASFSCDKTLNGSNGCRFHGELYANAGYTPLHPGRIGSFPLLPRGQ